MDIIKSDLGLVKQALKIPLTAVTSTTKSRFSSKAAVLTTTGNMAIVVEEGGSSGISVSDESPSVDSSDEDNTFRINLKGTASGTHHHKSKSKSRIMDGPPHHDRKSKNLSL